MRPIADRLAEIDAKLAGLDARSALIAAVLQAKRAWLVERANRRAKGELVNPSPRRNSDRNRVIIAAAKRGLTLVVIANQFGVSRERVRQIVAKYERENAEKIPRAKPRRTPVREWRVCPACGKGHWRQPSSPTQHCSPRCAATATRKTTDSDLREAIAALGRGEPMLRIATRLGLCYQGLQRSIFMLLQRESGDSFTIENMDRAMAGHKWHWIAKRHGWPPSANQVAA
jgi:hypothetical protein